MIKAQNISYVHFIFESSHKISLSKRLMHNITPLFPLSALNTLYIANREKTFFITTTTQQTYSYISVFSREYIFMSITLEFFTTLLLNVPSYWNPAFSSTLQDASFSYNTQTHHLSYIRYNPTFDKKNLCECSK